MSWSIRSSPILASTYGPRVIDVPWGFAGLFRLDYDEKLFKKNYRNPVLVACTDGVGSKVLVAAMAKRFDTVGIDLVAMSVNDMLVLGAEPLFFLDYVAVHKLEPALVAEIVKGVAAGCREADCALLGGETAEMPDIYRKGDFDMAGFAVGVVEKDRIIAGKTRQAGRRHPGPGLQRPAQQRLRPGPRVCFKQAKLKVTDVLDELDGSTLGDALLRRRGSTSARSSSCSPSTGSSGSFTPWPTSPAAACAGNIPRVLPQDCNAVLKKSSWPRPKIFNFLQKTGPVEEDEMFRVFNMGIGYVVIVAADFADAAAATADPGGRESL